MYFINSIILEIFLYWKIKGISLNYFLKNNILKSIFEMLLLVFKNKNTIILILYDTNNFNNVYILLILSLDEKYLYLLTFINLNEIILYKNTLNHFFKNIDVYSSKNE